MTLSQKRTRPHNNTMLGLKRWTGSTWRYNIQGWSRHYTKNNKKPLTEADPWRSLKLGMVKCKQLACDIVHWPGMNAQIEKMVSKCSYCQENRRQQETEPLMPSTVPSRPWEVIAADLLDCEKSHNRWSLLFLTTIPTTLRWKNSKRTPTALLLLRSWPRWS